MTRPTRLGTETTYVNDFQVGCRYPRSRLGGESCTSDAEYLVQRHAANCCRHPSLEDGCSSSFVCAEHLVALEAEADSIIRRNNPPKWMFWRRETGWCRSCGTQRLQLQTDVLQTVIALS